MSIEEMNLEQVEARMSEIEAINPETYEGDAEELRKELETLGARFEELEKRQKTEEVRKALEEGTKIPEKIIKKQEEEGRKTMTFDSNEYRVAWDKMMLGLPMTDEERTAFTHTTGTTSGQTAGYTIPTTLVNKIWDLIEGKHAILGDITIYRTGTILEVVKRTAIAAGDAGTVSEAAAPSNDENNTFAKVTLAGKDFAKTVKISYALGIMSMDGFESFIVNEIGERLGAALAADIVTQILTDYDSTNNDLDVATSGKVVWTDVAGALAVLKNAGNINVYASQATIYKYIVGMVDTTGRPIFQHDANEKIRGYLAGFPVKAEDAVTDDLILIGDPDQVVGNMVQDIMVESDKNIENHTIVYAGYARFQCALVAPKAFAKLDVTP
jgi:HK97 family phage major capsid protein